MSISDYKGELLSHLKEILEMEGKAMSYYQEIANEVKNASVKSFFEDLAEEERGHSEIAKGLIKLLQGNVDGAWHEPATGSGNSEPEEIGWD